MATAVAAKVPPRRGLRTPCRRQPGQRSAVLAAALRASPPRRHVPAAAPHHAVLGQCDGGQLLSVKDTTPEQLLAE